MKKLKLLIFGLLFAFPYSGFAQNYIYGDVNGDGEVNIADVNALIDQILTGKTTPAGDVNGDGEVNIADVNAVIDIILKS